MVRRFSHIALVRMALIAAAALGTLATPARADLIGRLCDAGVDPATVMASLSEEAEATGMPSSILNRLLALGYNDIGGAQDLRQLLCSIVKLEEEGIHPEPLFEKIAEGLGKRAPLKRINAVALAQADKLRYAQTLLSNGKPPKLDDVNVERLADLLDIGISRADLASLFDPSLEAPTGMRVVAAEILGYGGLAGMQREELERIITTGLKNRSLTHEWSFFIKVVKEARKHGISDERITAAAVRSLAQKQPMAHTITALGLESDHVFDDSGTH